jgi:hypothetical protein
MADKMKAKKGLIAVVLCLLLMPLMLSLSNQCFGQNRTTYKLRCIMSHTPNSPVQTQEVLISFALENLGDNAFNGTATLRVHNEKRTYGDWVTPIVNLTNSSSQNVTVPYTANDNGFWWATVVISTDDYSNILQVYAGSDTKADTANSASDSFYVLSLDTQIQQQNMTWLELTAIATIITAIATTITALGVKTFRRQKMPKNETLDDFQKLLDNLKSIEVNDKIPESYRIKTRYYSKTIKDTIENGKTKLDKKFEDSLNEFFEEVQQKTKG